MTLTQIQARRGTAAAWASANPVLLDGEFGWEDNSNRLKIGDGVTAWNSLPYLVSGVKTVINVKDVAYGAKGDGVTDDSAAIQAAINAAFGTGIAQQPTVGGVVYFPTGTYIAAGLILKGGVYLQGAGAAGNAFSDTDANLPPAGTYLKLKASSTADLVVTDNFAALNATPSSATAYNCPARCGIYDMVLDGNKAGASSGGRCLSAFARSLTLQKVIFQNAAGADGVYINGPSGGGETELLMSSFRVITCTGNGLNLQGAHDLIVEKGVINNNGGIGLIEGVNTGSALFTDVHVYSSGGYNWQLNGAGQPSHVNCVSDGTPGVQILTNAQTWYGGAIYGTNTPADELICLGDGTTRTVRGCVFITPMFQLGLGGRMFRYRSNTTTGWNKFISNANLNANNSHLFAGDGYTTIPGSILATATSFTVANGPSLATGNVVISDGIHITTATVSSISTNTVTLSAAIGTAMNAGASIWNYIAVPGDTYQLSDANAGSAGFYQVQSNPSGSSVWTFFDSLKLVGLLNLSDGNGHIRGAVYSVTGTPQGQITGVSGDYAFRTDGTTGANIYRCTGGTNWTAIV